MANKSIVYWASPIEIAALPNTAKNMVTNNLVKTRFVLDKILDHIIPGDKVGVKVHVGEAQNTRYLRPDYVREVVMAIKSKGGIPTLIETQGRGNNIEKIDINEEYSICVGHRKKATDHIKIAQLHGYTESITGVPLHFIDGNQGIDRKIVKIDGIHFKEVSVASGLFSFDKLVVISHFKGHPLAGFGGALKQLGMGCVTKHNKVKAHFDGNFVINVKKCDSTMCKQECIASCPVRAITIENGFAVINHSICHGCFRCALKCPVERAIRMPLRRNNDKFVECFIDNAKAVLSFGAEKIRYINFAFEIPLMCDCVSNASVPIVPDLGIYGSSDPVAIDKACVDAETNAPGLPFLNKDGEWTKSIERGIEKFKNLNPMVDTTWQIEAAIKNKLGSKEYELIKI
ncbi:MAG: DUF362 domain-containing protein [Promethearchaeota archaeon]